MDDVLDNVYITLQKEEQLIYTIHADFIKSIKRY
jgi:hypothetical protein